MIKTKRIAGISAAMLLAGALTISGTVTANAATPNATAHTTTSETQLQTTYELQAGQKNGRAAVVLTLENGSAKLNGNGSVDLFDAAGNTITTYAQTIVDSATGESVTVEYEVSADGHEVIIYSNEPTAGAQPGANLRAAKRKINQKCALNNLLWGMGGGAFTGAPGGIPGIAIGALTGGIISGIQSATSC